MNQHVEGRQHGAALKPLSGLQIRELAMLARQAFSCAFPLPDLAFDEWRRQQCMQVVERPGLTRCRNEDYLPLKAHFLRLAGDVQGAERATLRHSTEPRRWAMHQLERACMDAADVLPAALEYAAGCIRNRLGLSLEDADDKALWWATYTVRRKAMLERKREIRERGAPRPLEGQPAQRGGRR
jgi:hypothetical protein